MNKEFDLHTIEFFPQDSSHPCAVRIQAPAELAPVSDFIVAMSWTRLQTFSKCLADRVNFGHDLSSYEYYHDESGNARVRFETEISTVDVLESDFDCLVLRFFDFVQKQAVGREDLITRKWWRLFLENLEKYKDRLAK